MNRNLRHLYLLNFAETFRKYAVRIVLVSAFLSFATSSYSQERTITAGFQFKPIFSSKFFNSGPEETTNNGIRFRIEPNSGYCLGMVIRKGITGTISFETGINYVRRNYSLTISDTTPSGSSQFRFVGYEIPLEGLVFIRLSEKIYMDVALGLSMDFYPSDVTTRGEYFLHYTARKSWYSPSLLANIGWEYRTEKSGYFYLGSSFHRPFGFITRSFVLYPENVPGHAEGKMELQGNYLTVDVRYFFHSDPERRKKKYK